MRRVRRLASTRFFGISVTSSRLVLRHPLIPTSVLLRVEDLRADREAQHAFLHRGLVPRQLRPEALLDTYRVWGLLFLQAVRHRVRYALQLASRHGVPAACS